MALTDPTASPWHPRGNWAPVTTASPPPTCTSTASRQPEAFGAHSGEYAEIARLWKWTIDLAAGTVTEEQTADRPGDVGRVDDRKVGQDAQCDLMAMAGEGNAVGA